LSLSLNTLTIGKVLIEKDSCVSTNLVAKELLAKTKPLDGTAIITTHQSAGRGQFGNVWQSKAGKNITLSVVVYPKFLTVNEQFYLSKIVSLACFKTCETILGLPFLIKWPNDIYFKAKKIGGILIENQLSGNAIQYSILGIGLNVNQIVFENLPSASSLSLIANKNYALESVLKTLLQNLDAYYLILRQRNFKEIDKVYFKKMLGTNQTLQFKNLLNNKPFKATVKGVNKLGQLILNENGVDSFYNFKEVEWIL
jgi:BirA family biotin operon repressor/biotin-[acetyl-CoA-carboxylase] ligase